MHRILSIILGAALIMGLCPPAMAANESADARLARVTLAVKDTLELDTEDYPDFRGEVYEQQLGTVWSLNWSGSGASLSVEALEDGTVLSYWRSDNEEIYYPTNRSALPTLPKLDTAAAKDAANAFLKRVLDPKTETVELGEPTSAKRLNVTSVQFHGTIKLNGLPSPLSYSITVRGADNVVTSFRCDAVANGYLGGVPSATPRVGKGAAADTLKTTLNLELIYVRDGDKAVLRYVPKDQQTRYVDAQTGKLVDPADDLYLMGDNASSAPMATEEAAKTARGLTEAELTGVAKLEGVLDKDALDKLVRAESAYRLDNYSVASADYRLVKNGEDESVQCTLRYAKSGSEDSYTGARSFTVDARTGAVKSISSWGSWDKERVPSVTSDAAKRIAEDFFKRWFPHAGEFELRDTDDRVAEGAPSCGFTFVRKVNGYFFPENACTLRVDCEDGGVCGLSLSYDEKITFDDTQGLISDAAALDAWMVTYDVVLAYRGQSKALDKSNATEAKLIAAGYTRFRTLLLSYGLERDTYVSGIDAKTGKPVAAEAWDNSIAYGDLGGHWAKREIETLADYGVGYAAESFRPNKALTQWELAALLASTQGMRVDPDAADASMRDSAYNTVFYMGALARTERDDDRVLTRGELVRVLLDSAGCKSVAGLRGVFTCAYADREAIPADELGYAALAQGFGLVVNPRYESATPATRAVAAVMLCRLMSREA